MNDDARKSAHLLVSVLLMDVASFDVTADDDQLNVNVLLTFATLRREEGAPRANPRLCAARCNTRN